MQYHPTETRKRILDCATAEFLQYGYKSANIRRIAGAAEVTTGAIYQHFKNKDGLFAALVKDAYDSAITSLSPSEDESEAEHARSRFDGFSIQSSVEELTAFSTIIYEKRDAFELLIRHADGSSYAGMLERLVSAYSEKTSVFLKTAKAAGIETKIPDDNAVHFITNGYILAVVDIVLRDIPKEQVADYIRNVVVFYTTGLYKLLGWEIE